MPTGSDARPVTRLFPETAKNPAEFFVNVKLLGMTLPDASYAVNTPMTAPAGALLFIVRLLKLMVIELSGWKCHRRIGVSRSQRASLVSPINANARLLSLH
jgi:hypothetical protein